MSEQNENKNRPDFNVYTKVKGKDGEIGVGQQVGVAWKFKEKAGYNLVLNVQPIPIDGTVQLIMFEPKDPLLKGFLQVSPYLPLW